MSLLTIVQYVCGRQNVNVPATVFGTTDPQVQQMMRLLEEEGNDLSLRGHWEGLTREVTHTTLAAEDQGAITSIATNGFRTIKNDTIWDRTSTLPILGPVTSENWQAIKAVIVSGPRYQYRLRGGKFLVNPVPTAGLTWAFEYLSKNWILGANGTTYKQYFTLDTDTVLLPEELMILGLRWRWLKEKGLAYADLFNTYEEQVKTALGQDGGKPVLNMSSQGAMPRMPGIFVPVGSWTV